MCRWDSPSWFTAVQLRLKVMGSVVAFTNVMNQLRDLQIHLHLHWIFISVFINRIYVSPFLCISVSLDVNYTAWKIDIAVWLMYDVWMWDGVYVAWRTNTAKELVSHDARSNVYNYKHVFSVEIVPVCKDDVVCLPASVARQLGNMSQICVVLRVTQVVRLIDINTCHSQCSVLFT